MSKILLLFISILFPIFPRYAYNKPYLLILVRLFKKKGVFNEYW